MRVPIAIALFCLILSCDKREFQGLSASGAVYGHWKLSKVLDGQKEIPIEEFQFQYGSGIKALYFDLSLPPTFKVVFEYEDSIRMQPGIYYFDKNQMMTIEGFFSVSKMYTVVDFSENSFTIKSVNDKQHLFVFDRIKKDDFPVIWGIAFLSVPGPYPGDIYFSPSIIKMIKTDQNLTLVINSATPGYGGDSYDKLKITFNDFKNSDYLEDQTYNIDGDKIEATLELITTDENGVTYVDHYDGVGQVTIIQITEGYLSITYDFLSINENDREIQVSYGVFMSIIK